MGPKAVLLLLTLSCAATVSCRDDGAKPSAANAAATQDEPLVAPARSRPSSPEVVEELIVRDLSPELLRVNGVEVDVESLVRSSFADRNRIVLRKPGGEGEPYSLGFGLAWALIVDERPVTEEKAGTLFLVARGELGRKKSGFENEEYTAELLDEVGYAPDKDGPLATFLPRRVRALIDRTRDRFVVQLRIAGGNEYELLEFVGDEDNFAVLMAAREVGERGLLNAVPALIKALDRKDPELRLVLIGALGRLRDPRAVDALAARTSGVQMEEVRQAVYALGDIGGPKARRYLKTIAYSHPNDVIKAAAQEALARAEE